MLFPEKSQFSVRFWPPSVTSTSGGNDPHSLLFINAKYPVSFDSIPNSDGTGPVSSLSLIVTSYCRPFWFPIIPNSVGMEEVKRFECRERPYSKKIRSPIWEGIEPVNLLLSNFSVFFMYWFAEGGMYWFVREEESAIIKLS